jgi:hypothetical protein
MVMVKIKNDLSRHFILAILCGGVILFLTGCSKSDSTATMERLPLRIVDLSNKPIAHGYLLLPRDMDEPCQFTGSYEIVVTELPKKPSNQLDYAVLCLSHNNGAYSGRVGDGVIRLNLHPLAKDGNVYLEGTLGADSFKGTCLYENYYGYLPFGTFEANRKP